MNEKHINKCKLKYGYQPNIVFTVSILKKDEIETKSMIIKLKNDLIATRPMGGESCNDSIYIANGF
jgi:hypothetical protein